MVKRAVIVGSIVAGLLGLVGAVVFSYVFIRGIGLGPPDGSQLLSLVAEVALITLVFAAGGGMIGAGVGYLRRALRRTDNHAKDDA